MIRFLLGALASLALVCAPALADTPAGMTEIQVSGNGSVALAPDVANVSATVETNAANAADAVGKNNAAYDRIVAALEKTGVARNDITLASYNVNYNPKPHAVAPSDGTRYGYTVSREFNVKVRDIGKAGSVADACTSSGATSMNGVTFGLADSSGARAEATRKAVADARTNADALAAAAHLHIVSIKSVEMGGGSVNPQPIMFKAVANAPTQFDQSNVNVSIYVTVTFLAQP